jgi:hypothetical protein
VAAKDIGRKSAHCRILLIPTVFVMIPNNPGWLLLLAGNGSPNLRRALFSCFRIHILGIKEGCEIDRKVASSRPVFNSTIANELDRSLLCTIP